MADKTNGRPALSWAPRWVRRLLARSVAERHGLPPGTPVINLNQPPPWKISDVAAGRARAPRADHVPVIFTMPEFPKCAIPSDLPKEMVLANDEQIIEANAWAAGSVYANGWFNGVQFMGYPMLSEMAQRPEYRRVSEVLATEATRKWIKLGSASTDEQTKAVRIKELTAELVRLDVQGAFRKLIELDGFFGRSHLYLDTGSSDDRDELKTPIGDGLDVVSTNKFRGSKGFLKAVKPIEPVWCYPAKYNANDPLKADWYNPQTWFVQGKEMHVTRLLTFVGREVPDLLKPSYAFGGLSLSQMLKPYVDNWLRTRQAVADLIWSFSVRGIKTDLSTAMASDGDALFRRMALFANLQTNQGLMVMDKDTEEFFSIATPLGTLDALQSQAQEHMCSVSGTPVVKLLGIQPAGLNASSDGELTVWYDWVEAFQEKFVTPKLKIVLNFMQMSLWGEVDPEITFTYESLRALSEKELAEKRKLEAETDGAYVEMGALGPQDVRNRLAADPDSPYDGLDIEGAPGPGEFDDDGDGSDFGSLIAGLGEREPRAERERTSAREGVNRDRAARGSRDSRPRLQRLAVDEEWHEEDHPRAPDGKFGSGGAASSSASLSVSAGKPSGGLAMTFHETAPAREVDGKKIGRKGEWRSPNVSPERVKALAIPPGWQAVHIAQDPDADLQAIGVDAKGRPQYRYSEAFAAGNAAKKFERIAALKEKAPALEAATIDGLSAGSDTAAAVRLMLLTGLRPGSEADTGAEKKAHGATNLRKTHVNVDGDVVRYDFVGKEGVRITNSVSDPALARYIARRKGTDDGDRLFNTDEVRAREFIKAVCGGDFKSKDLRTMKANALASSVIANMEAPKTEADRRKAVNHVGDVVSYQLGNTRAMALSSYINPILFDAWRGAPAQDGEPALASVETLNDELAIFGEFFDRVSYAGNIVPEPACADDDDGND